MAENVFCAEAWWSRRKNRAGAEFLAAPALQFNGVSIAMMGTIFHVKFERSFFWIKPDPHGKDVFCHRSACVDFEPEDGCRIEFELGERPDGRMYARDARLIGRPAVNRFNPGSDAMSSPGVLKMIGVKP